MGHRQTAQAELAGQRKPNWQDSKLRAGRVLRLSGLEASESHPAQATSTAETFGLTALKPKPQRSSHRHNVANRGVQH